MRLRGRFGRVVVVAAATLLGGTVTAWTTTPDRVTTPAAAAVALTAPTPAPTGPSPAPTPETRSETSAAPTASAKQDVNTHNVDEHDVNSTAPMGVTPTTVNIPRLNIEMPVIPTGVDSVGEMEIPPSPLDAGWYRYGPGVGAQRGAAVIAAHVDAEGQVGPLARLGTTRQGDELTVRAGASEYRYRIESVTQIDKDALDLPGLFDRGGTPRLHLVTCGGRFDRAEGHYEDNVVVVAVPE